MRTASRVLLGLCLTAGAAAGPALPALAAPASGSATVKPTAEAWYRTAPVCSLPTGCTGLGSTPSPYPADTLHVGVNAGAEEARTFLQLDLAQLPIGAKPTGGTLLLPVASSDDGTRAASSAKVQVCAVNGEVKDADGSFDKPPQADCGTASAPATFVPAAGDKPAAFSVDLAALTAAWGTGAQPGALALLPAKETAPPASWHVAFSDRTRTGEAVVPITATLTFVSAALSTESDEAPAVAPPPLEPAPAVESANASIDFGTTIAAPALGVAAPMLPAPVAQAAPAPVAAPQVQQVVPAASFVPTGFRYPAVFLLPLLLALASAWIGRAMTQDLVSAQAGAGRDA